MESGTVTAIAIRGQFIGIQLEQTSVTRVMMMRWQQSSPCGLA